MWTASETAPTIGAHSRLLDTIGAVAGDSFHDLSNALRHRARATKRRSSQNSDASYMTGRLRVAAILQTPWRGVHGNNDRWNVWRFAEAIVRTQLQFDGEFGKPHWAEPTVLYHIPLPKRCRVLTPYH